MNSVIIIFLNYSILYDERVLDELYMYTVMVIQNNVYLHDDGDAGLTTVRDGLTRASSEITGDGGGEIV